MTKKFVLTLTAVVVLALPGVAQAHKTHHTRHHSKPAHHYVIKAQKADVALCNEAPEQPWEATWAEWRAEMAEVGFTSQETAELEVC